MQWRRRRRVLAVVGASHRALLLRGLVLVTEDDDERLQAAERRWLDSPRVRAVRELIQRFHGLDEQDDGSEDEESRDGDRGAQRNWKPRPRFHQQSSSPGQEKRTFNEDEYTRITTPRQDVLFKKGYLGRKRPDPGVPAAPHGYSNTPGSSANGEPALHNGEGQDADCGDGSDMMDDQAYYYPGAFVDPASGMYYVNGGGYDMYDPYTGAVTVVVGPGMMGMPPMGLPPIEWFNPTHGPPHGPPHMGLVQLDYCYMHGRKRYSVDSSQNCSGQSSESAGSGPPSGSPSSPQDCDSGGLPSGPSPGPSPGPPPLPHVGPLPFPPPPYMYPYMFGAPLYSLDGVSVQGGPPYGPVCDGSAANKKRKKKRRRKRRRGGTDDGSEESSSEDNQLEEGAGSLSSQSVEDSAQATPPDSDAAFPEFVPKALNGNACVWEPSILTPPQTPTTCEASAPPPQGAAAASPAVDEEPPAPVAAPAPEQREEPSAQPPVVPDNPPVPTEATPTTPSVETAEEATPPAPAKVAPTEADELPVPAEALPAPALPVDALSTERAAKKSAPTLNGDVSCVSKKAPCDQEGQNFGSSLSLPVCNGEVICYKEAVESESQTIPTRCFALSNDSEKDVSGFRIEKETFESILNNKKNDKQRGKANQNKNAVNVVTVKGGNKIVNGSNGKIKKCKDNSSPDHGESNGFPGKTRLSASPSRDGVSDAVPERSHEDSEKVPAQNKTESLTKTKGQPAKRKAFKKGTAAKTDVGPNANGVMAQTPVAYLGAADECLSLRPETSLAWGRMSDDAKVRPVDDVLLQALVSSAPSAETKADIPADPEPHTPAPDPAPHALAAETTSQPSPTCEAGKAANRLTPSSGHRHNRPKKWRQNTKERAPTPGRELTASSSSLSSDEGESSLTASVTATTTQTMDQSAQRESPLRITEAVTAWLRDHEAEEVLVPAVEHAVQDSDSELEGYDEDVENEEQQPKNALGNPFRASSHSSTSSTCLAGPGRGEDVEKRVASPNNEPDSEPEAAWDTLCDPSLFVAKYYRLGEEVGVGIDPMPAVVALELRSDLTSPDKLSSLTTKGAPRLARSEQHDSGVHSDESGDEHQTPKATKDHEAQAQAEEFAAKSAYLLRQLKAQSPGVPCDGICCAIQ